MDFKEIVKLQFVAQMGSAHASQTVAKSPITMLYQVLFMFFMSIIDDIARTIPAFCASAKEALGSRFKKRVAESISTRQQIADVAIPLSKRHHENSVLLIRNFEKESGSQQNNASAQSPSSDEANAMVDAILSQISKLDNVPMLKLIENGSMMISYKETPIQLTKDVFAKIESLTSSPTGGISNMRLVLISNTLSAAEISKYVQSTYQNYLQEIKNALGSNIYFFDQKSRDGNAPPPPNSSDPNAEIMHKRMIIQTAPKQLNFTMTPFYSNKLFSNIFGEEVRRIEQRVLFFLENRDWYDRKGIPYQLGILLSGIPGAGKTSVIRAIANLTRRHIVNVNFANIATATQLKNLFYSDKLQVYADQTLSNQQCYHIPIDQRLYVLEEIDAIGDIVKQRVCGASSQTSIVDELTLAEILTVLDGTMEVPGRIVIMTTNHPEVLDRALIRPGRIDVRAHFGCAPRKQIVEMFEAYLDASFPCDRIAELPDRELSPAEVGQVLFRHFDDRDVDLIVADLSETAAMKAHEAQLAEPQKEQPTTPPASQPEAPPASQPEAPPASHAEAPPASQPEAPSMTREEIAKVFESLFSQPFPEDRITELPHLRLNIGDVSNVMLYHAGNRNVDAIIADLRAMADPKDARFDAAKREHELRNSLIDLMRNPVENKQKIEALKQEYSLCEKKHITFEIDASEISGFCAIDGFASIDGSSTETSQFATPF